MIPITTATSHLLNTIHVYIAHHLSDTCLKPRASSSFASPYRSQESKHMTQPIPLLIILYVVNVVNLLLSRPRWSMQNLGFIIVTPLLTSHQRTEPRKWSQKTNFRQKKQAAAEISLSTLSDLKPNKKKKKKKKKKRLAACLWWGES